MSFLSRTRQQENTFETMYVLKEGSGMILELPGGTKGATKFRVFPAFDDKGNEKPMRLSKDDGFGNVLFEDSDFSEWIYPEWGVRRAGSKGKFTAFFRTKNGGDQDPSPLRHFWTTLGRAIFDDREKGGTRFPTEWYGWVGRKGQDKQAAMSVALPRPGWMCLTQGLCFENRGKVYKGADGKEAPKYPCVYLGPLTVLRSFETLLNQKKPGVVRPKSMDDFLLSDVVGTKSGCILSISLGDVGGIKGYTVSTDALYPLDPSWVMTQRKKWEDVVRVMDDSEQVTLLCTHFDAEAVDFALRGSPYEHLLPDGVRGAWGRPKVPAQPQTTVAQPAVPATPPAGAAAPAQPYAPAPAQAPVTQPPSVVGAPVNDASVQPAAPQQTPVSPPPAVGQPVGQPAAQPAASAQPAVPLPPALQPSSPPAAAETSAPFDGGTPVRPTGDAGTDLQNMQSVRDRLVAANQALQDGEKKGE